MILPTTDISIMDVRNALGYPSTDLGTLCSCNKINMWAKYKPVRHEFTSNRPSNWWQSKLGNCGITFNTFGNVQGLVNGISEGNGYTYQAPTGGTGSPYRLGDFAGYKTDARPPVQASPFEGTYYKADNVMTLNLIQYPPNEYELTAQDVYKYSLSNMYFGAAFLRSGYSTPQWITTSTTGLSQQLSVPLNGFYTDEIYTGYLFLCNVTNTSLSGVLKQGTFIPLPNTTAQKIEIKGTNIIVRFENVLYNDNNRHVTGQLRVLNNSAALAYFEDVYVDVRYADSSDSDNFEPDEGRIFLSDFSVSPQGNKVIEFDSGRAMLYNYHSRGGKVYCYANRTKQAEGSIVQLPPTPDS